MKVLILFCLAGVGLLLTAAPAYARTVRKDLSLQRQHSQLNLNNNNNRNNKYLQEHTVEASVVTLKSEVNAVNTLETTLETTLEPPHTTKSPIRFGEKQRTRANSKFLQRPEDANVLPQHTVNNDELELVENTTESPKRQLTTAASDNNKSEAAVDPAESTAKLRENKKQEVDNEKPAEAIQSGTEVSGTKNGKENKNSTNNGKRKVNAIIKIKKPANNNKVNKVNANKKGNKKTKQRPLDAQNKQKKSAPKTNRKVNKSGNKNKKTNSNKKSNRRNRRRNRFRAPVRRRPNRRLNKRPDQ